MWTIKFSGIQIQMSADSIEDLKNKIRSSQKLTEAKIYDTNGSLILNYIAGKFNEIEFNPNIN